MLSFLLRIWGIILTVARRLPSQWGLVLAMTAGLVASITLILSVPMYADAIYYRMFLQNVQKTQGANFRAFPPFNFLFSYNGGWAGTRQWEDLTPLTDYLTRSTAGTLGLPQKQSARMVETEPVALFPSDESNYKDQKMILDWAGLGFMSDMDQHILMVEGKYPTFTGSGEDSPMGVMLSASMAEHLGAQVGDSFTGYASNKSETGEQVDTTFPIRVTGIWTAKDPNEDYWLTDPRLLDKVLFVPEQTFSDRISPYLPDEVYTAYWYFLMDGDSVRVDDVNALLSRITLMQKNATARLSGVDLGRSPLDALVNYRRSANLLTIFLYAFSIPVIGLILAFISLVAGLSVERQRNQIAVLRSRGASSPQILAMVLVEGLLLGAVALLISLPLAVQVVSWIGKTRSFLDFSANTSLNASVTLTSIRMGLLAIAISLAAQVLPAIHASRHTIVSYAQERARMLRAPWWQRVGLDILLLIPAAYGTYLLRQQGALVLPQAALTGNPFGNPLLFLVPALAIFALTLVFLRLIPPLLSAIAWLSSRTRSVGLYMAARQLSRTPAVYTTPLVILVLTLSLSAYTASVAYTLDNHLYDQNYYQVGSDMSFSEFGETKPASPFAPAQPAGTPVSTEAADEGARWMFLPASEYLKADGVEGVVRVGAYKGSPQRPDGARGDLVPLYGIDRADFARVAFWRGDFAPTSLGALMNQLALNWNGVLAPCDVLRSYRLRTGDPLRVTVQVYGERADMDMTVAGCFNLFPTWYPDDGPLLVANLDYIFEQIGQEVPYQIWLKLAPTADPNYVGGTVLPALNPRIVDWSAAKPAIVATQEQPERQGLFGLLFIGFAAAAILTLLGFLLYVLFSFQRRFIELGVLRASGLSQKQMASYLTWELVFLILFGVGAGTALGALASRVYIPYLQVGLDAASRVPPFHVEVAWTAVFQMYALFGALFIVTLIALVVLLRRIKIFQAIKLGETV